MVRSERRYRELVEHSLGLICVHDLDGQFLFVNPAAARSLGYGPSHWEGRNLREFVAVEARPLFDGYLQRIAAQREDSGLMRVLDRQGQEHIWMYHNVRSEAPGEAPCVVGHALDITDRVRAEQAARRHREDLERAYRTLDDRVRSRTVELEAANQQLREEMAERRRAEDMREAVMTRERSTLTFLAAASDQLTQAPDYEATLKTLARLPVPFLADWTTLYTYRDEDTWCCLGARSADGVHKPLFAQLLSLEPQPLDDECRLAQVARTRELHVASCTTEGAAGSIAQDLFGSGVHLQYLDPLPCRSAVVVPLVIDDRVLAILTLASATPDRYQAAELVVIGDLVRRCQGALTQVRLYREAQEANRLKDEFLATLSHELRTPLNAMLGWARILRSRSLDEKTDHAVQVIERNAEAQARLIEDVLDVSRIITGKLALEVEPVHLPAVVLAALDSIRPAATAKGIRLVEQLEPASTVGGDPHRLQQVIWNLLSNAVKFTNTGGSVSVSLRDVGDAVEIAVTDTGMGIRREVLPFVFDRFRQADPSTTRSHAGLGLGLAIVRHLVELHGGTVRVRSVVGQGTTFVVELPARASEPADVAPGQMVLGGGLLLGTPDQPLRGVRALVVDDHRDARELATAVLQTAGAWVLTAASSAEALDVFARETIHVLVADIGMPGQDGYDLIRTLRTRPAGATLVAIALTGYARAEDRARALEAGFDRHVVKPAEPAALVMLLRALLDQA
ncbi:MAG: ATP-binding protein [Rhizobacter sp.]